MRIAIFCTILALFVILTNGKIISEPVMSYENYQVLRVKIDSRESLIDLSKIEVRW